MVLPSSKATRENVLVLLNFMFQIVEANRFRSTLVLVSSTAAAATQASILLLLNQGLTGTSFGDQSTITPSLAVSFALGLTVLAAWLQFASRRLVISIWVARRNQNLLRLDNSLQQIQSLIHTDPLVRGNTEVQRRALQILVNLRSLNHRQGLAVRASFGIVMAAMSLTGLLLGASILNAPITLFFLLTALLVILPLTLRHGAQMASNERAFRLYSARSLSSFKELVRERLSQQTACGFPDLEQDHNYRELNQLLLRRLNTPNWNRAVAVTLLVGGLPLLIGGMRLFGYQTPPIGTLVVLLLSLLAALTQIASLSGLITNLGRFLDSITGLESGLAQLASISSSRELATIAESLRTMSAGDPEGNDISE